jgi:prepilin-type N-terminal cleavage/methylation domain-containing protein
MRLPSHARDRRGFTLVELTITIVIILILATIALSIGNRVLRKSEADETKSAIEIAASALHEWAETKGRQPSYGSHSTGWTYSLTNMSDPSIYQYDVMIPDALSGATDPQTLLASRELELQQAVREAAYQVWGQVQDQEAGRAILAKINSELLKRDDTGGIGSLCLYDAWDHPVMVVHAGRKWRTGGASEGYNDSESSADGRWRDEDGTIRTFEERLVGPARNGRLYLVSAGPDGRFGNVDYLVGAGEDFPPPDDPTFIQRPEFQHTLDNIYSYEVKTW